MHRCQGGVTARFCMQILSGPGGDETLRLSRCLSSSSGRLSRNPVVCMNSVSPPPLGAWCIFMLHTCNSGQGRHICSGKAGRGLPPGDLSLLLTKHSKILMPSKLIEVQMCCPRSCCKSAQPAGHHCPVVYAKCTSQAPAAVW